ncbi:MAG TPA: DUF5722 domain-containing protein [Acidimicrobiales bacterium]|nr:DUF5722 domain-containing protein [Acidimicrobiales bacterium]
MTRRARSDKATAAAVRPRRPVAALAATGALVVAIVLAAVPGLVHTTMASAAATGQAPQRFSAAQLADPGYYPERGFWDVKGVTRFGNVPDEADVLATMGIARFDASWAAFEPTLLTTPCPSGYDTYDGHCFKPPADVDARIKQYTDAGMPVMAIVFATPAWARGTLPCVPYNAWSDVFCVPDHAEDFARFAGYLARHYDGASGNGRVTDFVIQNEVNLNQWFNVGCGAGTPCDLGTWVHTYADEYNAAYDAIRSSQANAKVMISLTQHFEKTFDDPGAVHPAYSVKTFLPLLVPLLGDREWSLALHPYPRSVTPAIDAKDLPYATLGNPGVVVGWLRATYPDVPSAWEVEFTEQGFNNPGLFDTEQADAVCRAFQGVLGTPGIKSFIYHSLRDNIGEFGLFLGLLQPDGTPKPAFATWLAVNDPAHSSCGFENAGTTVVRTGVDPDSGATWSSSRPLPAGYEMQPRQWRLSYDSQPGTVLAYECGDGDDDATPPSYPNGTWLSLRADCDGATPMGPVGWIHTTSGAGLTPLFTCADGTNHTTVEGACPGGTAATSIGYAAAEDVPAHVLDAANHPSTTTTTTVPVDVEHPDLSGYDVVFEVTAGSFQIGNAGTVTLPDGDPEGEGRTYLVGSWNEATGALDVQLLVPTFTSLVQTTILPDPVPTSFTMTQIGAGFGSLDPDTGAFRVDLSVNTKLGSPDELFAGFIGANCVLGPTSLSLTTQVPFDLTAAVPTADAADEGFAFPAARGCGDNGNMDQVLNPALELPTTTTRAAMSLAMIQGAPGAPTTTSTTSTSTPSTTSTTTTSNPTTTTSVASTSSTTVASTTTRVTSVPATTTATTATSTSPPTSIPTSSSTSVPAGTAGTTVESTREPGPPMLTPAAPARPPVVDGQAPAADPVRATPTYTG